MVEQLKEVLAALKDAGVLRGSVKMADLELAVEFAPELPTEPLPGLTPEPGGWKNPVDLDAPMKLDSR